MRIEVGAATDIGKVREVNEDAFLVEAPLFAVADGMGGHRGGDVASSLALETVEARFLEGDGTLADQVRAANSAVHDRSVADRAVSGMGTTLTAVIVEDATARLAHVGDSRGYLLRAGDLRQITSDHTLVARMVKAGEISPEEAAVHPHRNVITRSLGTEPTVVVDEDAIPLLDDDRLLLCSDGLTSMVQEDQILAILEAEPDPQRAADRLVRAANRAGGVDNITVLVLDAHGEEGDPPPGELPRLARRPSPRKLIAGALVAVVVVVGALFALRAYIDRQWYVGESAGRVAVFRGIPARPLGITLSDVVEETDLAAADVVTIQVYRDLAEGISAESRDDAEAIVTQMREDVAAEATPPSQPTDAGATGGGGERGRLRVSEVAFPTSAADTPRRPVTGLWLLVIALVISIATYAMAGLGLKGRTPRDLVVYAIVFCGAFVAAWLVVRWTAPRADPVLFPTATALAGLGIAMLYRIMVARGESTVAREQAMWLLVGLAAFCLTLWFVRDDRQLNAYTYTIGLVGVVLLLLPVVPGIGREINGARLWAQVGPFSFQPAEFGKIFIVVFLASYLADKQELLAAGAGRFGMPRAKDLGPLLLAWGASLAVLFLERDLGASLLFFGLFVVMIWVASGRAAYLWIGLLLFAAGAWFGYLAFDHVQMRVDTWLHALDPDKVTGLGYFQLAQGWFAMATGGIVGTGLGQGSPTLIPYVGSDFIFAAFGEELGMIGAAALLLLYLILIARGLRIAMERDDTFGKLLATGLTTILALQTFAIVAGVTRLIPLTGVPLPLVSYGGSSRVATFIMLALLIRVSSGPYTRVPSRRPTTEPSTPAAVSPDRSSEEEPVRG